VAACNKFIYTESLREDEAASVAQPSDQLRTILGEAVQASMRDDGWSPLSTVASLIRKTYPDFDQRNYGYKKLGALVRAQPFLEVKPVNGLNGGVELHVRLKDGQTIHAAPDTSASTI
jgi:hypothetical protein